MGTYIHLFVESRDAQGVWHQDKEIAAYDGQNYALFGWLADVRNYSGVGPAFGECRGIPADAGKDLKDWLEERFYDGYSLHWIGLDELLAVNYADAVEDLRDHGWPRKRKDEITLLPGEGEVMTLMEFLGEHWMGFLESLSEKYAERPADARIVFYFS